jgi:hypothetical protein
MSWPSATDYNAAVQNPQVCFRDADLRAGQAVGDLFGLPRPHSGNFADVYQVRGADGQGWAVKCFTRPVSGLRQRYQAISDHLRHAQRAFMVDFRYLEEGICVRGQWYPVVKMRWVEGFTLNAFVREQLDRPAVLDRLAHLWARLAQELRDAGMAHGDLQHGNVLLVPGSKRESLALRLIDYDGMWVPALSGTPSGEVGHPNYQHPQRLREGAYDPEVDHFPHLLIYTALRCLRVGGPALWERYDSGDNLLFREEDFRRPAHSRLLRELWALDDRDAQALVGHLLLASRGPLLVVPSLDELVDEDVVRPLTGSEEAQVHVLLGSDQRPPAAPRKSRVVVVPQPPPDPVPVPEVVAVAVAVPPPLPLAPAPAPAPVAVLVEVPVAEAAVVPEVLPAGPPPLPRPSRNSAPEVTLARPAADRPAAPGSRLDPIIAMLSRPLWLGVLGAVALGSLLLINVLLLARSRQPQTAPVAAPEPHLLPLDDVVLKGGYRHDVRIAVERDGCEEPLTVRVEGLPEGVTAPPPLTLTADHSDGKVSLLARLGAGPPPGPVHFTLWRGERKVHTLAATLTVQPVPRPSLVSVPARVSLVPGKPFVVRAEVERNGCQEPLTLHIDELPADIGQTGTPSLEPTSVTLELKPSANAKPLDVPLWNLSLRVGDDTAATQGLFMHVETAPARPAAQLRLVLPDAVRLKAGEGTDVPVQVERNGFAGPVKITLNDLPEGVTYTPATVAASGILVNVRVAAEKGAAAGRAAVKVLATPEGRGPVEAELTLVVENAGAEARRPAEPVGLPKPPQIVRFSSVDGVRLVGTLFPGSLGKKGACVLLVHDLSRHRQHDGWQRLALALQAEGHTVLSFDFRGHGDSTAVDAVFWNSPANRVLPEYRMARGNLPQAISARSFPPVYAFWLALDLAAARMYLDVLHDDRRSPVNAGNLVVIGAGEGATLALLWLGSECRRYLDPLPGAVGPADPPEGKRVIGAAWLSIDDNLGKRPLLVPAKEWARLVGQENQVPLAFLYGEKHARGAAVARTLSQAARGARNDPLADKQVIAGTGDIGQELLQPNLGTKKWLVRYAAALLEAGGKPWAGRDVLVRGSHWLLANSKIQVAKVPGGRALNPVPLDQLGLRLPSLRLQPGP